MILFALKLGTVLLYEGGKRRGKGEEKKKERRGEKGGEMGGERGGVRKRGKIWEEI